MRKIKSSMYGLESFPALSFPYLNFLLRAERQGISAPCVVPALGSQEKRQARPLLADLRNHRSITKRCQNLVAPWC